MSDKLKKMALAAIKAGNTEAVDTPWGEALRTDYTHVLPEDYRNKGYRLGVDMMEDGSLLSAQLLPPGEDNHEGVVEMAIDDTNGYGTIGLSHINDSHQGKGVGSALYEAALAHAKNVMGVHTVGGGTHSSLASKVHARLAAKHGLNYKATKNIGDSGLNRYATEQDWNEKPNAPFDSKYKDYEYVLKEENALFKDEPKVEQPEVEQPEAEQDGFAVVHNIHHSGLVHAHELGGIPAPSLAISSTQHGPPVGFGNITLVGGSHLVNPEYGVPVFDADVYSPRHPRARYEVKNKEYYKLQEELSPIFQRVGSYTSDLKDKIERYGVRGAINEPSLSPALKLAYLNSTGRDVKDKTRPAEVRHPWVAAPSFQKFAAENPEILQDVNFNDEDSYGKISQAVKEAIDSHVWTDEEGKPVDKRMQELLADAHRKQALNEDGRALFGVANSLWDSHSKLNKIVPDKRATGAAVHASLPLMEEDKFKEWAENKLNTIVGKQYIPKGKRKIPYNLENIVKEMTGKIRAEEGFNYGLGSARALGAKKFRSLNSIRQAASTQIQSPEHFRAKKKELDNRYDQIAESLSDAAPTFPGFSLYDALAGAIGESYKRGRSVASALKAHGFSNVTPEQVHAVRNFAADLLAMPTEYFEAKPQRAVGINEFSGALVPHDVPQKALDILSHHGIQNILRYSTPEERKTQLKKLVNQHKLFLSEKLDKMALADIKAGAQTQDEKWKWTDYSHLLPEKTRNLGYSLRVRSHPTRKGEFHKAVITHESDPTRLRGDVTFAIGIDNPREMNIVASSLDRTLRGQGLGLASYEAAMAHSKNHLGATHIVGDTHSSLASATHSRLAAKHGLNYKPVLSGEDAGDKSDPGAFDDKYAEYSYALKSELKKTEAFPEGMDTHPADFYGQEANTGDISRAKENPENPHFRAKAAQHHMYDGPEHALNYLDDPHPVVREVARTTVSRGLLQGRAEALESDKIKPEHIDMAINDLVGDRPYGSSMNRHISLHPLFNEKHLRQIYSAADQGETGVRNAVAALQSKAASSLSVDEVRSLMDKADALGWKPSAPAIRLLVQNTKHKNVFEGVRDFAWKDPDSRVFVMGSENYSQDHARRDYEEAKKNGTGDRFREILLSSSASPLIEDLTADNVYDLAHNHDLNKESFSTMADRFASASPEEKSKWYHVVGNNESPHGTALGNIALDHFIASGAGADSYYQIPNEERDIQTGLMQRFGPLANDTARMKYIEHKVKTGRGKQASDVVGALDTPEAVNRLPDMVREDPSLKPHAIRALGQTEGVPFETVWELAKDRPAALDNWANKADSEGAMKLLSSLDSSDSETSKQSHLAISTAYRKLEDKGAALSFQSPNVLRIIAREMNGYNNPASQELLARGFASNPTFRQEAIKGGFFTPDLIEPILFKDGKVDRNVLDLMTKEAGRNLANDQSDRLLVEIADNGLAPDIGLLTGLITGGDLSPEGKVAVKKLADKAIARGPAPTGYTDQIVHAAAEADALGVRQARAAKDAGFEVRALRQFHPDDDFNENVEFKVGTSKLREVRDRLEENPNKPTHKNNFRDLGLDLTPYTKPGTAFVDIEKVKAAIEGGDKHRYNVSHDTYDQAQLHSDEPSRVFQMNLTDDLIEKLDDAGVLGTFRDMQAASSSSGHPIHQKHGIGWVRYTQDSKPASSPEKEECAECDGSGWTDKEDEDGDPIYCPHCGGDGEVDVETRGPGGGNDHIFIDEIQSDFGQDFGKQILTNTMRELERRADREGLEGEERERYIAENSKHAEEEASKYPPEHTKKIAEILFGGRHANELIAEAFMQYLRNEGSHGSDITMHSVDSKAPISLGDSTVKYVDKEGTKYSEEQVKRFSKEQQEEAGLKRIKNVPAHFFTTYDQIPRKLLGMKPATYGEFPTETGQNEWEHLEGAKTWHKRLRKMATVATDIEKLAARYNPSVDGETSVNHIPHMTAHPKTLNNEVRLYNEHIAGGDEPHFASPSAEGQDVKLLYRSKPKDPNEHFKHFIVKAYHDQGVSAVDGLSLSKGWKEMTHQALYHAGGIGDLHQKVHVANHDYKGTKIPSVVIHVDHESEGMEDLPSGTSYKDPDTASQRKKIHLMDFLTDNQDRHLYNIRYRPTDKKMLAIDHGDTFNYNYADAFSNYVGDDYDEQTARVLSQPETYDETLKWWGKNSDNVKAEFGRHVPLIRDPELRQRTYDAFMRRANLLDKVAAAKKGGRNLGGTPWIDFDGYEDEV